MPYKNKEKLREYQKQWRIDNREKIKEYKKQYRIDYKEKLKEHNRKFYIDNFERIKKRCAEYRENNRDKIRESDKRNYKNDRKKIRERQKQWYENNIEKVKKCMKRYQVNNKKDILEYQNRWMKERLRTDLKFSLNSRIKGMVYKSLRKNKNGWHWELLVGYNLDDLKSRLNNTMPVGYAWKDFLSGELHIDHIIPIKAFNFTRPEHTDFKRCWALSNLRLLPAKENLIKNAKLDRPFQMALRI